ncbi:hypothetical protein [Pedobacter sp. Leaf170]|uniref:hypothetical protein n=1 Tax=Pedobacter sp. Leaf170 TaxID=2876558 RepID=UPI001E4F8EAF|nr:hypothetical protein [Pedobacter sp. Leaf170]
MTNLKTMANEELLAKIGGCKNIEGLTALKPVIDEQLSALHPNDYSGEIILKMYGFAMHTMQTNPTIYPFLNFKEAINQPEEVPKAGKKGKSIEQLVEEDPLHLYNRELDNQYGFWENGKYFFQQADVPALLKFLQEPELSTAIKHAGLLKSVQALQRFYLCYVVANNTCKNLKELRTTTSHIEQKKPFPTF